MRRIIPLAVASMLALAGCATSAPRDLPEPTSTPDEITIERVDWTALGGSWETIVTEDIAAIDCDGLQQSFESFEGMSDAALDRSDFEFSGHAIIAMIYVSEQMERVGCYG